ncbi:amino ABC transporter, permease, 3-TM region, His/Glu/Gln/Arg/opine family domain protein [Anoxybacillus sp. B7M1]|jgi:glutamine transport system permease protein|uniref:Amino acid ABC transporter permease n=1 Tax=Anoxybacteroides rupiense TaxID=311460 RepID=A0ABD5IXG9_9BACL|nr:MULTISPECIES: amino acid ABC transporter permease [Anoxybacillus]ANB57339.1 amino ABC transporter, permease, 3-TM region, His/Glu/Gln/Arg/opine family domain protein [Anoxybacillus sp. B2M1]ANB65902.1 amino ABC transporter, permease, 3-TM region, His/Glu/Gln/Arg/opine family domain protein [Anoxybacillus sp. B7M1]KXG08581.1 Inner membrane amino-acid ABC transporter permease protein YecS [Anoxybacillus sp. P3H1B]MBB3908234.1 polar amino acid transport system permease protein [Anoxybacillus ru
MDFRFDIIQEYAPFFLKGLGITIFVSIISIVVGSILGLAIGLGKMSTNRLIRFPFEWYVNFFRGTPLLVQMLLVHFGLMPIFFAQPSATVSLAVSLSLNSAAYVAEIFRAGIQSIDKGQMEAARSLGMTHTQAMRYIILPQALKRMIPPFANEFIVLIKDSSLGAVIAAPELMYWGRAAQGQYYRVWEPYLTVALIYLILTLSLSKLLNYLERKYSNQ